MKFDEDIQNIQNFELVLIPFLPYETKKNRKKIFWK